MGSNPTFTAQFKIKMHKFKIGEWVLYHRFLQADLEFGRLGKNAIIIQHLENKQYIIYVDDQRCDFESRRIKVNEENLESVD